MKCKGVSCLFSNRKCEMTALCKGGSYVEKVCGFHRIGACFDMFSMAMLCLLV